MQCGESADDDAMTYTCSGMGMLKPLEGCHLIEGHLHGEAFVVLIGHSWTIQIQQDKLAMICDDASSLIVNLLQVFFAESAKMSQTFSKSVISQCALLCRYFMNAATSVISRSAGKIGAPVLPVPKDLIIWEANALTAAHH